MSFFTSELYRIDLLVRSQSFAFMLFCYQKSKCPVSQVLVWLAALLANAFVTVCFFSLLCYLNALCIFASLLLSESDLRIFELGQIVTCIFKVTYVCIVTSWTFCCCFIIYTCST